MIKKKQVENFSLLEVCKQLLDDANLNLNFSLYPDVELKFTVQGKVLGKFWEVVFKSNETIRLVIQNDNTCHHINNFHLVLETNVVKKEKKDVELSIQNNVETLEMTDSIYFISIYGDVPIELVCCDFNWELNEISDEEYHSRFGSVVINN